MKQSMQHLFSQIPRADIQRSVFNRHHTLKTSFNADWLVPIFCDEVLPGDTFTLDLSLFGRLSTMAVPVMDNIYAETFFFAVPNRLLWSNWQKFCGEQEDPGDSTDYVVPTLKDGAVATVGSLSDYLGIPTGVKLDKVSALWHRAYALVFNEWFRDENLQNRALFVKDDGPDDPAVYGLLKRGKRHDYFTSCLPWPQKGPGVMIPLTGNANVYGTGSPLLTMFNTVTGLDSTATDANFLYHTHHFAGYTSAQAWGIDTTQDATDKALSVGQKADYTAAGVYPSLYADLSSVTASTINDLRTAFQVQKLYEADARGGTRYTEILRSHFGVVSPDARLQRPEYLGGTRCRINVHPVSQQSATDSVTPQGNLAAFATMGDVQHVFTKSFTEHCVLIGLVNVYSDLTYQQGLNRMFSRRTRFDYYWPTLAHLGEQAVLNKEIYAQDNDVVDSNGDVVNEKVFGYQERWAEYRYKPSMVTGQMRTQANSGMDVWHLAQAYNSLPQLDWEWIQSYSPLDRVLAVTSQVAPQIIMDVDFDLRCARPMPVYSVPGLIDHF